MGIRRLSSALPTSATRLAASLAKPNAVVIDLRPADDTECIHGLFHACEGAISAVWNGESMPVEGVLPETRDTPLVLQCRSGRRAVAAADFLAQQGFTDLTVGGGPAAPELWEEFGGRRRAYNLRGMRQLFDLEPPAGAGSSTFTYLLSDAESGEAILIDPVLEQVERDLSLVEGGALQLKKILNTHVHADHITGSGELKRRAPGAVSYLSKSSGGKADVLLDHGDVIEWAGGTRKIRVIATPGHTTGCVSYYDEDMGAVFTGDALLIRGCGRTDFQEGDAATLFNSVHNKLFTLPPSTLVFPAHDYKKRSYSTVADERRENMRFSLSEDAYIKHMNGLALPTPKLIDVALPRNLRCGC